MSFNLNKVMKEIANNNELSEEFSKLNEMDEIYDYCKSMGVKCGKKEFDEGISEYINVLNEDIGHEEVFEEKLSNVGGGISLKNKFSKSVALVLSALAMGSSVELGAVGVSDSLSMDSNLKNNISFSEKMSKEWSKTKEAFYKFYQEHKKMFIAVNITVGVLIITGVTVLIRHKMNDSTKRVAEEEAAKKAAEEEAARKAAEEEAARKAAEEEAARKAAEEEAARKAAEEEAARKAAEEEAARKAAEEEAARKAAEEEAARKAAEEEAARKAAEEEAARKAAEEEAARKAAEEEAARKAAEEEAARKAAEEEAARKAAEERARKRAERKAKQKETAKKLAQEAAEAQAKRKEVAREREERHNALIAKREESIMREKEKKVKKKAEMEENFEMLCDQWYKNPNEENLKAVEKFANKHRDQFFQVKYRELLAQNEGLKEVIEKPTAERWYAISSDILYDRKIRARAKAMGDLERLKSSANSGFFGAIKSMFYSNSEKHTAYEKAEESVSKAEKLGIEDLREPLNELREKFKLSE